MSGYAPRSTRHGYPNHKRDRGCSLGKIVSQVEPIRGKQRGQAIYHGKDLANKEQQILAWFSPNEYSVRTGHSNTAPSKTRTRHINRPTCHTQVEIGVFSSEIPPMSWSVTFWFNYLGLQIEIFHEVREAKSPKVPASTRRVSPADQESDAEMNFKRLWITSEKNFQWLASKGAYQHMGRALKSSSHRKHPAWVSYRIRK